MIEQLQPIEDGEEIPSTEDEWRDYRILMRAGKEGTEGYFYAEKRPSRPQ